MKNIILASKEHLPFIANIEKEVFSEPWSEKSLELCLTEKAFCVCCLEDDVLLSYCTVITVLDEAQIINVATTQKFRGKGCAKAVLEAVFDECRKREITIISLEVRESNLPAISLYQSLGFKVEGKRKDFYKNPRENALVMIKNLD
jgi:ribosomal-protein-alanine N-acetyltransferase